MPDHPLIVFCSDPLEPRQPDQAFAHESEVVKELGLSFELIDFESLAYERDCQRAVRRVRLHDQLTVAVYRGWMLKPDQYTELYDVLQTKNIRLINDPVAYRHCHYLPESYSAIEGHTPRSVWMTIDGAISIDAVMNLLYPFGPVPVIVKDFVKSRKHEWEEACFIPSAADRIAVERVVRRFVELQDDDLNEGLVFREFIEFEPLAVHSQSGMPLTQEYRMFFSDGRPIFSAEYWDEGDYRGSSPPLDRFTQVAANVRSGFFTMDVAKQRGGDWLIVELGDGQVAGLPENANIMEFYRALAGQSWA